jgi:oxaloacetate decarboxylase gamma subunit
MENSTDLFYQAATLMLVGMGFVYAFLGLLIVVIKTVIAPLAEKFPDLIVATPTANRAQSNQQSKPVVAAISAAISQYRKVHKQQD